jgi:glutathione synthase
VVLVRHDPPVDAAWLASTWVLDHLPARVTVANPPRALRETPEKLAILGFPDLAPPTLVTRDPLAIRAFRVRHGDLVVKPLFGKAGEGVWFLDRGDPNFNVLVETMTSQPGSPWMVQRYQPEAAEGALRVMMVDGRAVAALRGVPRPGDRRGNLDRAAVVEPVELDAEQARTVARVGEMLRARGIVLAGIDLVRRWLLEVNVTSPGGAVYMDRAGTAPLATAVWEVLEERASPRGYPSVASGVTMSS